MKRAFAIVFAVSCAVPSFAVQFVVDDFSTGVPQSVSITGNNTATSRTTGSMFGESRALLAGEFDSAYGLGSRVNVVPGVAAISNDVGNGAVFWIGYLTTGVVSNGFTFSENTNADMSGVSAYELDLLSSDKSFDLEVFMVAGGQTEIWRKTFGPTASPTTITISVADNVFGSINMSEVDYLNFAFHTQRDGDLAISQIRAVPEPATLAVVGMGLATLFRRRVKK